MMAEVPLSSGQTYPTASVTGHGSGGDALPLLGVLAWRDHSVGAAVSHGIVALRVS